MASSFRTAIFNTRPLRSFVATARPARSYATIPTKNPTPSPPLEPSKQQAMPIGAFYEAILNSKQPIPDVKPEEPATTVKENRAKSEPETEAPKEAPKRGRKPKAAAASPTPSKTDPAATATASTAPTASPAATAKATAKEAANAAKASSVSSISTSISPQVPGPAPAPSPTATSTQEKAKVIFGSRLAGPAERAERLAQIRSKSQVVAGVMVPPKPEEPDNCCMSGCVNCVWDRFRDDMEEWALANAEVETRLAAAAAAAGKDGISAAGEQGVKGAPRIPQQGRQQQLKQQLSVDHAYAVSMDDDGGGSDTNWENIGGDTGQGPGRATKDFWDEELYKNVPVGIREFMKQEKRLKERHMREGSTGG